MALPHDLQLHRRLSPGHPHHAGDPRGLRGSGGATVLTLWEPDSDGGGTGLRLVIRADGAARGNPGPASAGAVLIDASRPDSLDPDAPPLAVVSRPLGRQTNNVAEYTAVKLALERARALGAEEVDLVLDSQLIVEQLAGRWKVRDAGLKPLFAAVRELLAGFRRWSVRHERRAENRAADALANLALDDPRAARALEAGVERPFERG